MNLSGLLQVTRFSCQAHVNYLTLLGCLDSADPYAAACTTFPDVFNPLDTSVVVPPTAITPKALIVKTATQCCIIIRGLTGLPMAARLAASYGDRTLTTQHNFFNSAFEESGDALISRIPFVGSNNGIPYLIVGHSYGGAVALYMMWRLGITYETSRFVTITYGNPRPGGSGIAQYIARHTYQRIYTSNDPVPGIPPHFTESPGRVFLANRDVQLRWQQSCQPAEGYQLSPDGRLRVLPELTRGLSLDNLAIADWLLGTQIFGSPEHTLDAYSRAAKAGIPFGNQFSSEPPLTVRTRPESTATLRSRAVQNEARAEIAAAARQNPLSPDVVAGLAEPPTPSNAFRPRKINGLWCIVQRGNIVSLATGKRDAHRRSKAWNKAARGGR